MKSASGPIVRLRRPGRSPHGSKLGTSKRYADHYDRMMDTRIAQTVMRRRQPETLTSEQLDLEREPLTRAPAPRPVKAWVRYGGDVLRVDAEAVAWTDYAVAVRWPGPDGGEHRAWVWAGAVRRR